jgi:nitrate/nitrite transporter NarK
VATVYGMAGSAGAVGGILFNTLAGYFSARTEYSVIFAVLLSLEPLGVAALWLWMREARHEREPVAA